VCQGFFYDKLTGFGLFDCHGGSRQSSVVSGQSTLDWILIDSTAKDDEVMINVG